MGVLSIFWKASCQDGWGCRLLNSKYLLRQLSGDGDNSWTHDSGVREIGPA